MSRPKPWMQAHKTPSQRYEDVQCVLFLVLFIAVLFGATVVLP